MSSRLSIRRPRSLACESLEKREVLSAGVQEQYMLQLINMVRTNPPAAAQWVDSHLDGDIQATLNYYGVDLKAVESQIANSKSVPPVAWSDTLAGTASQQSQDQVNMGVQTHTGANGSSLGQRLDAAGVTNRLSDGENAFAYSKSVDHAMEAFLIDWGVADQGHRRNILQPDATADQYYQEAGIGIVNTNKPNFGPKVITVDFARQANAKPALVGTAYNDSNGNNQFGLGEGQGGVEVDAVSLLTGQKYVTSTTPAGGWQLNLDSGQYQLTAKVNGQVVRSQTVSLYNQNIEVDYNLSLPWQNTPPAPVVPTQPVVTAPAPQVSAPPVSAPMTVAPPQPAVAVAPATPPAPPKTWINAWSSWTALKF
jgi:hypothetical protein